MIPTLQVVKVQSAKILTGSVPQLQGDSTTSTSGNLGRQAGFSDDDDWED